MSDINTKLEYLAETKSLIKEAIIKKGQTIDDNITFREFVEKITNISSGSFIDWTEFTETEATVGEGDTFTFLITNSLTYTTGDICLISYAPENGEDIDKEGFLIAQISSIVENTSQLNTVTFNVMYKFIDTNDYTGTVTPEEYTELLTIAKDILGES